MDSSPKITEVPLDPKYLKRIERGLDAAYKRAGEQPIDAASARIAIFSDHHKGSGDPADDFRRCEQAYTAALGYYLEEGFRLFILGDSEELWEDSPGPVIEHYEELLQLESAFRAGGGLERFYGNHDDEWSSPARVTRQLGQLFGADVQVREALRLTVDRGDRPAATLFFIHGHQGTKDADELRWIARPVVRYFWRPLQRRFKFSMTTPARGWDLQAKHDRAMFEWARWHADRPVLIAGHTHRPVFGQSVPTRQPRPPIDQLEQALADAHAAGDRTRAAALHAELEHARTDRRRDVRSVQLAPPCYFNTGCCSFPDGDITGLEIADGEIRLARWPGKLDEIADDAGNLQPDKRIRARETLENVFASVIDHPPEDGGMVEQRV